MALVGLATTLAACGDTETDAETNDIAQATQGASPLATGRALVDDAAQTIRDYHASGNAEFEPLIEQLDAQVEIIENLNLTPPEQQELEQYQMSVGQQLQPILTAMMAANPVQSAAFEGETCYSRCRLFLRFACENNRFRGLCAGTWGCGAQRDPHPCLQPNSEWCGDDLCVAPERCARLAFAPDRCVLTCTTDNDCPGNQRCRQPFGTAFRRCR